MVRARFVNDVTNVEVKSLSEVKRVNVGNIINHENLYNRNLSDQHPIGAITGLEEALEDCISEENLEEALSTKQNTLTAGANIQINGSTISATDTTYTAGTGISIENGVISSTQTSAEWGNIGGTLSDQTDLNNALNNLSGGIDSNHQAISSINQTISAYGNIVTHNTFEFATSSQGALADTAVQPNDLATVATSGSYADLSNKPTIPTVPTNVSAFTNDVGYITSSALNGYATQTWVGQQGYITSSAIVNMQTISNLVTSVSSSSTDSQYPSAKLFYDTCGDIETLINAL